MDTLSAFQRIGLEGSFLENAARRAALRAEIA
jgi:hypothetical protein